MTSIHIVTVQASMRYRALSRARVKALADSIAVIGLLNPITVRATGNEYTLVAGRHRLEAARLLGWQEIEATIVELSDIDTMLAEIDENLIRSELSDLERSEHLAERKRLYLLKHPETENPNVRGGPGRGRKTTAENAAVSYVTDTAAKTGASERTIRQDVQIAESIPEDVRDAIRETPLADSKTDLLEMARLPEDDQRAIVASGAVESKASFRQAIADHRPERRPQQEAHTTEVETTVDAFLVAIESLFTNDERRDLVQKILIGLGD